MRKLLFVLLIGLGIGLCACGSSGSASTTTTAKAVVLPAVTGATSTTNPHDTRHMVTTTTTTTAPSVAPKVLAILTNLDSQTTALAGSSQWTQLANVFGTAATQLQALTYPANAQADAKTVIRDLNKLSADATEAPDAGDTNLLADVSGAHADDDALRSDLGLPAAPTS